MEEEENGREIRLGVWTAHPCLLHSIVDGELLLLFHPQVEKSPMSKGESSVFGLHDYGHFQHSSSNIGTLQLG